MKYLNSYKDFQTGDKIQIQLTPTGNRYHNLYKGWTHCHGIAVNGKTGVIKEISDSNKDENRVSDERYIRLLVEFDNPVRYEGRSTGKKLSFFSFHFNHNELKKVS
jgi:hypothetical protein